jgi:hypothetical protein
VVEVWSGAWAGTADADLTTADRPIPPGLSTTGRIWARVRGMMGAHEVGRPKAGEDEDGLVGKMVAAMREDRRVWQEGARKMQIHNARYATGGTSTHPCHVPDEDFFVAVEMMVRQRDSGHHSGVSDHSGAFDLACGLVLREIVAKARDIWVRREMDPSARERTAIALDQDDHTMEDLMDAGCETIDEAVEWIMERAQAGGTSKRRGGGRPRLGF